MEEVRQRQLEEVLRPKLKDERESEWKGKGSSTKLEDAGRWYAGEIVLDQSVEYVVWVVERKTLQSWKEQSPICRWYVSRERRRTDLKTQTA